MDLSNLSEEQIAMLPPDMIGEIISTLPVENVLGLCEVSPRVNWICGDPFVWQALLRRDFPQVQGTVPNPYQVYMEQYRQKLAQDQHWIQRRIEAARQRDQERNRNRNEYWQADNPNRLLVLPGAIAYVQRRYPNAQGYDRFVYWPDYSVAGTVNDIVRIFKERRMKNVNVGELNRLTGGRFGSLAGTIPLSEEVVYQNSIDPLNPEHARLIPGILTQLEYELQQQAAYQRESQRIRRIEDTSNGYNGVSSRQLPY